MTVEVTTSAEFYPGIPKPLFSLPGNVGDWDVTSDGKRFFVSMPLQGSKTSNTPITVVLNWETELNK